MIVKMKKITLLVSSKSRKEALERLRKLGVLHIHHVRDPQSQDIHAIETDFANLQKALRIIGDFPERESNLDQKKNPDHIQKILSLYQKRSDLGLEMEELRTTYTWFERWGDVSCATLEKLKEAGLNVRFYVSDKRSLRKLPIEKQIYVHMEEQGMVWFAHFSDSDEERLDFKEDPIPEAEVVDLRTKIARLEEEIRFIGVELEEMSCVSKALKAYGKVLEKRLEFSRAVHGMGEEDHFVYLQGFVPVDRVSSVTSTADNEEWGYILQDPDNPSEVPTLIVNPKWIRIINPIFKFMGTVPGYSEHDISFWFLLFFSLFFAILIGDAGYGLLFIGISFFLSKKAKHLPREPFILIYVLSGATLLWGLLSGNWFGFESIGKLPFLRNLIIDDINSFSNENQLFMMYLCFIIGILHLSVAHLLKAVRYINSWVALSELGWVAIMWSLFFVAGNLVIGNPLPWFTGILFITGVVLTLIFSNFQKNIIKGIFSSLGNLPLSIISSFSDIVSYLRLFAVGYASVTVASSFNSMAIGSGINSILGGFIAACVLFLGHGLNIMLGLMSVIVHGIRLNMLEFSGHLSMQWAGKEYSPFKE